MKKAVGLIVLIFSVLLGASMTPEARKSLEALKSRAEDGDGEAMYRLSGVLERGYDSIAADTVGAVDWLRRSAEAGYAPARNYLGYLYGEGKMVRADMDSSYYWIRLAADSGDPKASHNIAYMLLTRSDMAEGIPKEERDSLAVSYLYKGAEAGLPQSLTMLGDLSIEGRGMERDTLQAVTFYTEAIREGFRDAELKLLNVIGPEIGQLTSAEAMEQALYYFDIGAYSIGDEMLLQIGPEEKETARAYAMLGHAYSRGLGVAYDHRRANEYFARAAIMGNPSAQFIISETLEIFPDALADLFPGGLPEAMTAETLRESAAREGITTPEEAVKRLFR